MIFLCDTETTGLLSKSHDFMAQPGICQIGAVKLEWRFLTDVSKPEEVEQFLKDGTRTATLVEIDSFYTLVNPEAVKWEEGAVKTHGITQEMVKDAPTMFEIGPALARFALGCDTWGGYNTHFDKRVLKWQLEKYGLDMHFPWPPLEVDVMALANKAMEQQGKRGTKNPKLTEAYEHFLGKPLVDAHDALADIRATADVWRAIINA